MLSIGKLGRGQEGYYLQAVALGVEDYYLGSGEAPGRWIGGGCGGLGLSGRVGPDQLRAVLDARSPADPQRSLISHRRQDRLPGYDLTFSAPKGVLLLFALGGPELMLEIRRAHDSAVAAALGYLEREAGAFAESMLGLPYQWGGMGPLYDCSGLTQAAYAAAGVRLRRTSREQFWDGTRVALGDLHAGDLVFYASDVTDPATIHHLGLYVGGGRMIEAARTGTLIRYASIDRPGYIGAVRPIIGSAVGAT